MAKKQSNNTQQATGKVLVSIGDLYLSASIPFFFLTFMYMGFSEIKDPSYINDSIIFLVIAIVITSIGVNKKSIEMHGMSAGKYFFSPKFRKYVTKDMK